MKAIQSCITNKDNIEMIEVLIKSDNFKHILISSQVQENQYIKSECLWILANICSGT